MSRARNVIGGEAAFARAFNDVVGDRGIARGPAAVSRDEPAAVMKTRRRRRGRKFDKRAARGINRHARNP